MKLMKRLIQVSGIIVLLRMLVSCQACEPEDPSLRNYSLTERVLIGLSRSVEEPKHITLEDQVRSWHHE